MNIFVRTLGIVNCILMWCHGSAQSPPSVCLTTPPSYELGGSFEFIVTEEGTAVYKSSACTADGVSTSVGVINSNVTTGGGTRYLFGVNELTVIPSFEDIPAATSFTISSANEGLFWVMQIEKKGSFFMKTCRSFTVLNPPKPPAISHLTVDVDVQSSRIRVQGKATLDGFDFQLLEEKSKRLVDISSEPTWETNEFNPGDEPVCFQTQYRGGLCKGLSMLSKPVCSIHLSQSQTELYWTSGGFGEPWIGEEYVLQEVGVSGPPTQLVENLTDLAILKSGWVGEKKKKVRIVRVIEEGAGIKKQVGSNIIEVDGLPSLFFPNAFTPNNDGVNDIWQPISSASPISIQLLIYDRLGCVIFQSTQWPTSQWDGTFQGKELPSGVYQYVVDYQWLPGVFKKNVGSIHLIR